MIQRLKNDKKSINYIPLRGGTILDNISTLEHNMILDKIILIIDLLDLYIYIYIERERERERERDFKMPEAKHLS